MKFIDFSYLSETKFEHNPKNEPKKVESFKTKIVIDILIYICRHS